MSYQEKRSIAFLLSNIAITGFYCLFLALAWGDKFSPQSDDLAFWGGAILGIIPLHMLARILIMIAFAVDQHVHPSGDSVGLEDELDKLIDLKATAFSQNVFLFGMLVGLACLAFGLPAKALVFAIALSIPVSGIAGDAKTLIHYRRGV